MKNISCLLALLLILQSCNVYNIPTSVEEAVVTDSKTRVVTTNQKKYNFHRLENKNNRLVGVTRLGSTTARQLAGMPAEIVGKQIAFDLSTLDIEEIKLRNASSSTILTVLTIAGALIVTFISVFLISFASADWTFGTGSE